MPLFLLDRDGVVVVNRPTNIKTPGDLALIAKAPDAIARLNQAGFDVAICTNQPELARGVMTQDELDVVHRALEERLLTKGARVNLILCCGSDHKCPRRKPAGGMLGEVFAQYGASPSRTAYVG